MNQILSLRFHVTANVGVIFLCFSFAHGVVPRLIRSENQHLMTYRATSNLSSILVRPQEVKFITQFSGRDEPLFNPACALGIPVGATTEFSLNRAVDSNNGLCITRYGGLCYHGTKYGPARRPQIPAYGLANYSFGAQGSQVKFMNLTIPESIRCANDGHPRFFSFHGELFIYSWTEGDECRPFTYKQWHLTRQNTYDQNYFKNYIWKFGTQNTTVLSWENRIVKDEDTAKNFLFFQHEAKLLAIVTVVPHRVYEVNISNGDMAPFAETQSIFPPSFPGQGPGDVALSAGPVVLDDRRYLIAAHVRHGGRRMFFYTYQAVPPFQILEVTPLIYFTGDAPKEDDFYASSSSSSLTDLDKNSSDSSQKPQGLEDGVQLLSNLGKNLTEKTKKPHGIEYGMQMQVHGEELMMSLGIDDCDGAVVTVPLHSVTSLLIPVGKGPT